MMISELSVLDIDCILGIVNKAAVIYRGVIPNDRWKEPYMSKEELKGEICDGVVFFGWTEDSEVVGVMGIQSVKDVILIRHAYVVPWFQNKGVGRALLRHLLGLTKSSMVLVGAWRAAIWAIEFYEKNGFKLVSKNEKDYLLRRYWNIPERQIETSVVLKLEKEFIKQKFS
jgi:GNAT superfamily N-acetyltransferase